MNMHIHFMHGIGAQAVVRPKTGKCSDKTFRENVIDLSIKYLVL